MRAWPAPYEYYTLNKPTPAAQDETYGLRRKILGLRPLPPRNFRNRTTKKSCAFNVTGVLTSFTYNVCHWPRHNFNLRVKSKHNSSTEKSETVDYKVFIFLHKKMDDKEMLIFT